MGIESVVELKDVMKIFRKFPGKHKVLAVNKLSFSVGKGEIFGLLGPNGSGKTTTMNMLLGMLRPSSGSIAVLGKSPRSLAVKSREGFLPEASYLYPFLSGIETLEYYGRLANMKKSVLLQRIPEILELVGLSHASKRLVKEYSKGMGRRLQLAQVLLKDPDIFFMDEPTIGLDPIGSREMKDIILDLKKKEKTIVLTSHLLSEVESVCDRICILYQGVKITEGSLEQILEASNEYQIITAEMDQTVKDELRQFLKTKHIEVLREGHPKKKLEELFAEEVGKHKK